jgi:hypothetical protein
MVPRRSRSGQPAHKETYDERSRCRTFGILVRGDGGWDRRAGPRADDRTGGLLFVARAVVVLRAVGEGVVLRRFLGRRMWLPVGSAWWHGWACDDERDSGDLDGVR